MSLPELIPMTSELYGDDPAREPHVTVVDRWAECFNVPDDHPEHHVEFLHRQLNEEANVMENAAASLVDFPAADWKIRMWLARQCADEARHVLAYRRLLMKHGVQFGSYPVMNFQYRVLRRIDSLIGRLAVENRTFEADGLDAVTKAIEQAQQDDDVALATMYDSQQADEIVHVGFANAWIRREIRKDPRSALQMSVALTSATQAFREMSDGGGHDVEAYGVAHEERRLAGFEEDEIAIAHDQAEARRAAARAKRPPPGD